MLPAGLRLLPVDHHKRPLISDWVRRASSDPAQLKAWEAEFPGCLWGILCGEKFDLLDIDPTGLEWALANEDRLGQTYVQRTRRGGLHLYYLPTGRLKNSAGKIAPGVDIKTTGGIVIDWARQGLPTIKRPMIAMPAWLVELGTHTLGTTSEPNAQEPNVSVVPRGVFGPTDYQRNYAKKSLMNAWSELRNCRVGRNVKLNALGYSMGRQIVNGWISHEDVEKFLMWAARDCGLLAEDGEEQCLATLASGISAGLLVPYHDISPPSGSLIEALNKRAVKEG
jgi:hypothetical protein